MDYYIYQVIQNINKMIKHQILILFLCIAVVAWVAYTVRERKKSREKNEDNNIEDNL